MSDGEGFLSRWSRRKAQRGADKPAEPAAPAASPATVPEVGGRGDRRSGGVGRRTVHRRTRLTRCGAAARCCRPGADRRVPALPPPRPPHHATPRCRAAAHARRRRPAHARIRLRTVRRAAGRPAGAQCGDEKTLQRPALQRDGRPGHLHRRLWQARPVAPGHDSPDDGRACARFVCRRGSSAGESAGRCGSGERRRRRNHDQFHDAGESRINPPRRSARRGKSRWRACHAAGTVPDCRTPSPP